jgi:hypothetical protein
MGFYEDHILAVAKRQARKMKNGESEKDIRKFLKTAEWQETEIDTIIKKAKQIALTFNK